MRFKYIEGREKNQECQDSFDEEDQPMRAHSPLMKDLTIVQLRNNKV